MIDALNYQAGKKANSTGESFKRSIMDTIKGAGYEFISDKPWLLRNRKLKLIGACYSDEVYVGESVMEGRRRVDIFLANARVFNNGHILEVKWQQRRGSATNKLADAVNDAKETYEQIGIPTTIIYGGSEFTPKIREWLKVQVDGYGLYAALSAEEFYTAINNGFLGTGNIELGFQQKKYKNISLWEGLA